MRSALPLGEIPRFWRAFQPFTVDRIGLAEAVSAVSQQVIFGDLMFMFGLPFPVRGLANYKRLLHILMPAAGYLPLAMLYPPGAKDTSRVGPGAPLPPRRAILPTQPAEY